MQSVGTAPGKRSLSDFSPGEDRYRGIIAHEGFVNIEHLLRFRARLGFRFVHGVAFLPEEFGCAEKEARTHFPAHDVGPLVDQDRQVAIGLHPLRVGRADDCLRSRPNDERLGQRTGRHHFSLGVHFQPMMGHDRAFLGEAFDVLRLFLHVAERNEEREIGVAMPGRLEHAVERPLHVFPDAVAPRFDHHAAAHLARLGQVARPDDLLIPFGKIFRASWADGGFWCVGLGHNERDT